jgi:hypothetical protein
MTVKIFLMGFGSFASVIARPLIAHSSELSKAKADPAFMVVNKLFFVGFWAGALALTYVFLRYWRSINDEESDCS